MRVGNPKRVRPQRECASCHELRYIKSRNLCETCHKYATKVGTIEEFPKTLQVIRGRGRLKQPPKDEVIPRHLCGCFSPIPSGGYCLKCNKPVRR